jgi:sortase (surface protein transpeptidase)
MAVHRLTIAVIGAGVAVGLALAATARPAGGDAAPPFSAGLRYLGRDPLTGLPSRVDDRFIAESERAIERYGRDAGDPVPPPPPEGPDVDSLAIPALGVSAPVARLGLDAYGRLDVPQDTETVGWNPAYTSLPGTGGSTFFAAHFEYGGRPGVFFRLATLQPGSEVMVRLTDGSSYRYRVVSVVDYPLAAIDMGALLRGLEGRESIVLMTCSGPPDEGNYPYRTVVLAERVD